MNQLNHFKEIRVTIPLHTKNVNVEGDRIHGLALAKET
jgi:hypothetical protein